MSRRKIFEGKRLLTIIIILSITTLINSEISNLMQKIFERTNFWYFNDSIPDQNNFLPQYDFIIVGAGSAGSVMANRLSENNKWNILLIEAGGEETILSDVPISAGLTEATSLNWGYKSDLNPNYCTALKSGRCNWLKGRAIGGTSVINFLVYTRGNRRDYDEWSELGNSGWSYDEVLPYFMKSENIKIPELINSKFHGKNGYLDVENSPYRTKFFDAFLRGGKEMGYNVNDPNGEQQLGFSLAQATMRNGRRCSASKAFIRPAMKRLNLHISKKSWVTKILIDPTSKSAYGVEFLKNKKMFSIRANREVILCAGTIASPQLLMLSGVGPNEHLREIGIDVLQDLKVGFNLQDHASLGGLVFTVNQPITIIDRNLQNPVILADYLFNGKGPLTVPGGAEGIAFVKTANSTLHPSVPDIELVMGVGAISGDTSGTLRGVLGMTDEFFYKTYKPVINKHAFGIAPVLLKPKSRGRISLKSENLFDWPKMEANYFAHPDDMKTLIEGTEMAIRLAETRGFRQFGTKFYKTPYLGCEHLKFRSYKYWECCIREIGSSLQHQSGTCKMGPASDPNAVVNPQLQVYGVKGLRVVDASIIPMIPASHTNAVVFMIAEKAADMIKSFWKNKS